jgi:hypothetical protein
MDTIQNPALRNFTVLEILDRTFRLYRENFLRYAGLVAIVTVPLSVFNLLITQGYLAQLDNRDLSFAQRQAATSNYTLVIALVAIVVSIVQAVFVNGTLTYMASENHLGRKVSIAEAFSSARGRFMTLFLALLIFYLVIGALAAVSALTVACFVGILGLGLVVYMGVNINVFLAPTIVLENVSVMQGINRGWGLAKARFWTVLGLMALIIVISIVLQLAFSVLQQLFSQQVVASASIQGSSLVGVIIETIIAVFVAPISPIALTLLYYDTRVRLEGLDIALAATGNPNARPSDVISPLPDSALRGKDYANILILIVGGIVVVVVLGVTMAALFSAFFPGIPVR